jgi:hypothetical protein
MSYSTDDLREAARKKFAPVEFVLKDGSVVKLSPLLRLKKEDRLVVTAALKAISAQDDDEDDTESLELLVEQVSKILGVIADKPVKLLKDLDGADLLVKVSLMTDVVAKWAKETQLGEAGNSPNS